jgi:P63C domain
MAKIENEAVGRVLSGQARAASLSPERRKEIAARAAAARWGITTREATKEGTLKIAGAEIPCFILEDETRVLARAAFVRAIGRTGKVKGGRQFDEELQTPTFLTADNLKPYITSEIDGNSKPILFRWKGTEMIGYRAELLPDVCDVFQDAASAGVLRKNQHHIAEACRILGRGLTRLGIIGLVDEATGYQRDRADNALAKILEEFIAKELQPYIPTFTSEFYQEIFRLRGLEYPKDSVKRPQYFGTITNDIVYKRLAPGVLEELRAVTPRLSSGRLSKKLFQRLTRTRGYPKLREHLGAVLTMMQLSDDWKDFMRKLNRLRPHQILKPTKQSPQLSFDYDAATDSGKGL